MKNSKIIKSLTAVLLCMAMLCSFGMQAALANTSSDFNLRKKVINMAGITSVTTGLNDNVTRADFARMVILATPYRDVLASTSNVSVYPDVKQNNEYASAIRLCAENNFMSSYLGGYFKPDQYVTYNEAIKAAVTMLGYSNSDFAGDTYNKRIAKFEALSLGEYITKNYNEYLTKQDCINLFYNILKADTKQGKVYGTNIGINISSTGEIDALTMTDNSLKGPKYCDRISEVTSYMSFSSDKASVFIDGVATTWNKLTKSIEQGMIIYVSTTAKTVWAYTSGGDSDKSFLDGTVESILYNGTSTLTPSGVVIEGETFKLSSSDMQFAFSTYGSIHVGEKVIVIYTTQNDVKTIVDYTY